MLSESRIRALLATQRSNEKSTLCDAVKVAQFQHGMSLNESVCFSKTGCDVTSAAGDPLEMKTLVQQELIRRGILWSGIHNLCHAHDGSAEIDYTLKAYAAVLSILKQAVAAKDIASRLKGRLLQPVFRKTSHFNTKPTPV